MKSMTYKALMRKVEDVHAEVNAWSGDIADVTFFPANLSKPPTRREVFVTGCPKEEATK